MENLTGLLFVLSFILLIIGLIKPSLVGKMIKNPSRKKVGWIFGLTFLISFILTGILADDPSLRTNKNLSENTNPDSILTPNNNATTTEEATNKNKELYTVTYVVDGDTIDIDMDGKTERLRLIGIDTPETKDPRKPVQCFGQEASAKAIELLLNQKVSLEADDTQDNRDKYDRLLRYVYREDGLFFNKWMIENGYAYEYTYGIPYKYQTEFKQAQINAQTQKIGLWDVNTCDGKTELKIKQNTSTNPAQNQPEQKTTENNIQIEPAENKTTFNCQISKTCTQMSSCDEAYFYLDNCNKTSLDRDDDGIPCESICN